MAALLWVPLCQSQTKPKQPALIRDTDKAEGKDASEAKKPKEYDPAQSEKNVQIGDYYLKQRNYIAAIQRYLEAIEYQPNRTDAYENLARAYERKGDRAKAIDVYKEFLRKNPDSPRLPEFKARLAKLEGM